MSRRLILAILLPLALIAGSLAVIPAAHAATGFGVCSILQAGREKVVSGKIYKCVHIRGVGWLWIYQGPFYGCRAATRITRTC